jgi:hypothetical protein
MSTLNLMYGMVLHDLTKSIFGQEIFTCRILKNCEEGAVVIC